MSEDFEDSKLFKNIQQISRELLTIPIVHDELLLKRSPSDQTCVQNVKTNLSSDYEVPALNGTFEIIEDIIDPDKIMEILTNVRAKIISSPRFGVAAPNAPADRENGYYLDINGHNRMHISFHKRNPLVPDNNIHIKTNDRRFSLELQINHDNTLENRLSFIFPRNIDLSIFPSKFKADALIIVGIFTQVINDNYDKYILHNKKNMSCFVSFYMNFYNIIRLLEKNKIEIENIISSSASKKNKIRRILNIYDKIKLKFITGKYLETQLQYISRDLDFVKNHYNTYDPQIYNCDKLYENIIETKTAILHIHDDDTKKKIIDTNNNKLMHNIGYCCVKKPLPWTIFDIYKHKLINNPIEFIKYFIHDDGVIPTPLDRISSVLTYNDKDFICDELSCYIYSVLSSLKDGNVDGDIDSDSSDDDVDYNITAPSVTASPYVVTARSSGVVTDVTASPYVVTAHPSSVVTAVTARRNSKKRKEREQKYLKYKNKYLQLKKKILQQL
jgi:hypothetical protein